MGRSQFGEPVVSEVLKPKASSVLRLLVLLTTILLFLSQVVLVGGPQESVKLEASPDIVDTWAQVVNWTDPHDGETDVPLNKTIRVAVLGNYTLGNQVDWTLTPIVGGCVIAWTSDFHGNPVLEMYHDPFELCTIYTINITFYDDLMNPYDPYEFSFTTICGPQPPTPPILSSAVLSGAGSQDVKLTWQLSADDGAGENDVDGYAIYHSDGYQHGGIGYEFLASVPAGTNTFTHSLAGDGDPFNHFYFVAANDTSGNSNWSGQAAKFLTPLKTGKQIASIPLVQEDTTLEVVLQTLDGSYKHVRYYKSSDQSKHWKSYWTFKTYRTLFDIDHTMGLWIDIMKPDDLVVAGLVPEVTQIDLGHGWNFVSYPSFIDRTVSYALAGIDWKKAQGYDDTPPFNLRQLSGSDMMTAGGGYWVWVDLPQTWEVHNKPTDPPYIVWTNPMDGELDVPLNASIFVKFSKEMNTSSVIIIATPDPLGWGLVWSEGNTLLEVLHNPWPEDITLTHEVQGKDLDGNWLVPGPVPNPWTFVTVSTPPIIIVTYPADGTVGVHLGADIIVGFSEPMDVFTFTWDISPDDPGGWSSTWSNGNTTVTLSHSFPFAEATLYMVAVIYAEDMSGSALVPGPVPNPFTFSTGSVGPYIVLTDPFDGEIDIDVWRNVTIEFSKPMNTSSVSLILHPFVGHQLVWSNNDMTLVLIHPVPYYECVQIEFAVYGLDVDGNPLVPGPVPNPFTFATGCENPYILATDPMDGEINVPLDYPISVRFSEPMNTTSVAFTVTPDPGGWSAPIWYQNDTLMVLEHSNPFVMCIAYTVQVLSGTDKSGDPLTPGPVPNPWVFYSLACPYIVSHYPMVNQTNVTVTANIVIEFSWSMNASSLSWNITPDPGGWNETWTSDTVLVLSHSNPYQPWTTYVFELTYIEDVWGIPPCDLPFVLTFTTIS